MCESNISKLNSLYAQVNPLCPTCPRTSSSQTSFSRTSLHQNPQKTTPSAHQPPPKSPLTTQKMLHTQKLLHTQKMRHAVIRRTDHLNPYVKRLTLELIVPSTVQSPSTIRPNTQVWPRISGNKATKSLISPSNTNNKSTLIPSSTSNKSTLHNIGDPVFTSPSVFTFIPGQWVDFYVKNQGKKWENVVGGYSLTSSPHEYPMVEFCVQAEREPKPNTMTSWIHSPSCQPGVEISFEVGEDGGFLLREPLANERFVFVAAGIGITPFLSFLRMYGSRSEGSGKEILKKSLKSSSSRGAGEGEMNLGVGNSGSDSVTDQANTESTSPETPDVKKALNNTSSFNTSNTNLDHTNGNLDPSLPSCSPSSLSPILKRVTLIYSVKTPNHAIYLDELEEWAQNGKLGGLRMVYTGEDTGKDGGIAAGGGEDLEGARKREEKGKEEEKGEKGKKENNTPPKTNPKRISVSTLRTATNELLKTSNADTVDDLKVEFFLCGPPEFGADVTGLIQEEFGKEMIVNYESWW